MFTAYIVFFVVLGFGIMTYVSFRHPSIFLYLFLLGLPFDHITIPIGVMKVSVSDTAMVLLLISWIIDFVFIKHASIQYPVQVYLAGMLIIFIVGATIANGKAPESYFTSFSFSVKIIGYVLLLQLVKNEKQLITAIKILLIGAFLSTLLAFYQQYAFVTGGMPSLRTVMVAGTKAGLNTNLPFAPLRVPAGMNREAAYGIYLSFSLTIAMCIFLFRFSKKARWVMIIPLLFFLATLVMNDTRAAYLGISFSLIVALILTNSRTRYLLPFQIMFLPLILLPLYDFLFHHREASVISRKAILMPILEYALEHPLGGGVWDFVRTTDTGIGAHSSILQLLTHGGIPAMTLYIIILLSIFVRFRRHFKTVLKVRWSGSFRYSLYATLGAAFVGLIIQSEFIHPRSANKDHWAFLALIFLAPLIAQNAKEEEPEYYSNEQEDDISSATRQVPASLETIDN